MGEKNEGGLFSRLVRYAMYLICCILFVVGAMFALAGLYMATYDLQIGLFALILGCYPGILSILFFPRFDALSDKYMKFKLSLKKKIITSIVLLFVFLILIVGDIVFIPKSNICYDHTTRGECSEQQPMYCNNNGKLTENASFCGCPTGYSIKGEACVFFCSDGTEEGNCAADTHKYCTKNGLVDKASKCGCPEGAYREGDKCLDSCTDGTPLGSCSEDKPYYCTMEAELEERASVCGCQYYHIADGDRCLEVVSVSYDELLRNYEDYQGKVAKSYTGSVSWVDGREKPQEFIIKIPTGAYYGIILETSPMCVNGYYGDRILKGDYVTVSGEVLGWCTLTNGDKVPKLRAIDVKIIK